VSATIDAPSGARQSSRLRRWLIGLAVVALSLYAVAVTAIGLRQEELLFHPSVLDPTTVLSSDPDVHELTVPVPGAELSVVQMRLPHPKGVVFFLHGNSGSMPRWLSATEFYRRANFDLVMMDYRGFGKSTGHIESEAQLHADVRAVWDRVAPRYAGKRIVIYGRSLGTGLAAPLAAEIQPDLTILVSPYTSMTALARLHFPWVPSFVLRYPLQAEAALERVHTPMLLLHGDRDTLIPITESRALLAKLPGARLIVVEGAAHADMHRFVAYHDGIRAALAQL
jgi:pimeloyl-ACP methyl ester carboxylesterase